MKQRADWTSKEWLEYLEGWCFQRLGYPRGLSATESRSWYHGLGIIDATKSDPS